MGLLQLQQAGGGIAAASTGRGVNCCSCSCTLALRSTHSLTKCSCAWLCACGALCTQCLAAQRAAASAQLHLQCEHPRDGPGTMFRAESKAMLIAMLHAVLDA